MIRQAVRLACCIRAAGFVFITWSRVSISKTASALIGSEKPMVPLAVSMRHFRPVAMPPGP